MSNKQNDGGRTGDGPSMTSGGLQSLIPSSDVVPREYRVGGMGHYLRNGSRHHQRRNYLRRRVKEQECVVKTVEELNASFPKTVED